MMPSRLLTGWSSRLNKQANKQDNNIEQLNGQKSSVYLLNLCTGYLVVSCDFILFFNHYHPGLGLPSPQNLVTPLITNTSI